MPGGHVLESAIEKFVLAEDGSLEVADFNKMAPYSGILIYRLSVPQDGSLNAKRRFMVFWIKPMNGEQTFELRRDPGP